MNVQIKRRCSAWALGVAFVGAVGLPATTFVGASSAATTPPHATKKVPLFLEVDTVSTTKANDCQTINNFVAGSKILFRIKVFNGATGKIVPSYALGSVVVKIPGASSLPTKYGTHKTDSFWTALWTVPASYPTGVVNYTVTARAHNGQSGSYVPFNVSAASLTVVAS